MALWALKQSDWETSTMSSSPQASPPQAKSTYSWTGYHLGKAPWGYDQPGQEPL